MGSPFIVSRVAEWFGFRGTRPRVEHLPTSEPFKLLDLADAKRRHRLVESGEERGRANQPPSDSTAPDSVEHLVFTTIYEALKNTTDALSRELRGLEARLSTTSVHGLLSQLLATADSARNEFMLRVRTQQDYLIGIQRDLTSAHADLAAFREKHDLSRLAAYPLSRHYQYGKMSVFVIAESVANGVMLARGNALGLVGGVGVACLLALLNVSLGFIFGWKVLRFVNHRRAVAKASACLAGLAYLALAVVINLSIAHYRQALGAPDPQDAERVAVATILTAPLALGELTGWFLLAIGLVLSLAACHEGYGMDDPYPGYGEVVRTVKQLEEDYAAQKDGALQDLKAARDAAIDSLTTSLGEVDLRRRSESSLQRQQEDMRARFGAHVAYLEQCGNELLAAYRDANARVRTTPPPARFSERWKLVEPVLPWPVDSTALADDSSIAGVLEKVQAAQTDIEAAFRDAMQQYAQIDALTGARDAEGR
jgi:hypothetical protein